MMKLPIEYISEEEFNNLGFKEDKIYLVDKDTGYDIWFRNTNIYFSGKINIGIESITCQDRVLCVTYIDSTIDIIHLPDRINIPTFNDNILSFGNNMSIDLSNMLVPVATDGSYIDSVPTVGVLIQLIDDYLKNPQAMIDSEQTSLGSPEDDNINLEITDEVESLGGLSSNIS